MSITYNTVADPGTDAGELAKGNVSRGSLTFTAKATSLVSHDAVRLAGPFNIGQAYSYLGTTNPAAVCTRISVKQEQEQPLVWRVTYDFDSDLTKGNQNQDPEDPTNTDPLTWNPEISWRTEVREEPMEKGYLVTNGQAAAEKTPVTNSFGTRMANRAMNPKGRLVLSIIVPRAYFDPATGGNALNAVNADVFYGQPAGTACIRSVSGAKVYQRYGDGEVGFWKVHFEVHFDPDGWDKEFLDEGSRALENVSGTYKTVVKLDKNGIPLGGMHPLDGAGGFLSDAAIQAGNFKFRRYRPRLWEDFAPLGIQYQL